MFVTPEKSRPKINPAAMMAFFVQTDLHGVILAVSDSFSRTACIPVSRLINTSLLTYLRVTPDFLTGIATGNTIKYQQSAICEMPLFFDDAGLPVKWMISVTIEDKPEQARLEWYGTLICEPGNNTGLQSVPVSCLTTEESIRLQSDLIENVSDIVIYTAADFTILSWNKAAEKIYAVPAKEAIGERIGDLIRYEYPNSSRSGALEELETSGEWKGEVIFHDAEGNPVYLLSSVTGYAGENGKITGYLCVNRDITENIKAKESIKKSELFYRSLIGDSLDGIVLTDSRGIISFVAPSVKNILGYGQKDMRGRSIFEVVHPEDLQKAREAFLDELNRGAKQQDIVIRLLKQNGDWLWCGVRGHNLMHVPDVHAMAIYFNDNTRRKAIEDALRESEQRFRLLSENSKDIICLHEADGTYLYISPSIEKLLGYLPAELIGRKPFGYIHPEDNPPGIHQPGRRRLKQFITSTMQFRFRKKDGSYIWLETTTQPVYNSMKRLVSLQTISRDISERVHALQELEAKEQELLHVNERFELATKAATDAIWELNLSAGDIYITPEFTERFGYSADDMKNNGAQWYAERLHPEDRLSVISKLTNAFSKNEKFWRDEFRWRCRDGAYKYVYNRSYLFYDEMGRPYRGIGAIQDITERKKVESQLIQKDILLAASAQAANELLVGPDLEKALEKSLRVIGIAAKVDRTYIFRYLYDEKKGTGLYRQLQEWNYGSYEAQIKNQQLQHFHEEEYPEIIGDIKEGWPNQLLYKDALREPLKKLMLLLHIKSLLLVPVFVQGTFWGFVGFDECSYERIWTNTELDILKAFASNITGALERKEAERKLADSEIKFKSLFQSSLDIINVLDEQLIIRFVTPSVKTVLGYEENEMTGNHVLEWIHPANRQRVEKMIEELLMYPGQSLFADFRVKNKKGNWIWMEGKGINKLDDPVIKGVIFSLRDISDRKQSEQQLQGYSEHITSILNSITDGFIALNFNFHVLWWNQIATQLTGVSEADVLGKNLWEVLPQLKETKALEEYEKARETRTVANFELYFKERGIYFDVNAYPSQEGVFVYFKDITSKKKQEMLQALEKAVLEINASTNASLKTTVDYLLEGMEQLNKEMLCSVLLLEENGKQVKHLSGPSLPTGFTAAINGLKIGPAAGSCGTAMYLKKMVVVADISCDPLWNNYRDIAVKYGIAACWSFPIITSYNRVLGSFACYYKTSRSPTPEQVELLSRATNLLGIIIENKQAEEKLNISNERYLLATKATNDAIWDLDIKNNRLCWGESFYALFGYKPGQHTEQNTFRESKIHPDDRDRVTRLYEDAIENKVQEIVNTEYRFQKADGKYAVVADKAFMVFDNEGSPTRFVGSMQDVTQRKKMEKKLLKQEIDKQKLIAQAAVDAQEKERAEIGKELHDNVNQILSTAKLYLELAKTDTGQREELIKRSADSIFNAINEIRAISRALVPPSIKDLGLIDSVKDLVESLKMTGLLQVKFTYHGDLENKVRDKQKLMLFRIIQEQVSNILKHAEAGRLVIDMSLRDTFINLAITDNGKGFDPEKAGYKQGLGLSNIKSRANLFSGKVNITSAPGKGCKLFVQVPIHK
jgi:PAS domain S-box-containing protein